MTRGVARNLLRGTKQRVWRQKSPVGPGGRAPVGPGRVRSRQKLNTHMLITIAICNNALTKSYLYKFISMIISGDDMSPMSPFPTPLMTTLTTTTTTTTTIFRQYFT